MPLTRLDNLISSKTGKYLYVSPDDFNATDSLSNRGNSPVTPFKSIQRAFLEIARYSYTPGPSNDRFDQFSVMLMPGIHYIDNRPGLVDASGIDEFDFNQALNSWGDDPNLDISSPDNILYKFNNTEGGAIIPRGSSLVGYDLRRTTVRPLYVPEPSSVTYPRSAIFNVTGGCYFWQFTIKDGQTTAESPLYNPSIGSGEVYYDPYDFTKKAVPNFSHHKLTVFEYADKEELQLYYRKVAKAFSKYQTGIDTISPEGIPEFDFNVQENRIVGPLSDSRVIESLKFNDVPGSSTANIEVTTKVDHGYFAGQFVAISNTDIDEEIEGFWPIYEISDDPRKFSYRVPFVVSGIGQNLTDNKEVSVDTAPALGATAQVLAEVDSVESASPYVFNVSIRSVWGICGIWANGLKATGFKSMVIAQYTGVSLQRDDRAFIRYDEYANTWNQASLVDAFATVPYHAKGDSYWKDDWRNFHVRASDDAFIQNVSIFAVGFADHFLMESGGDMSITNSNSNFGNTSLHAIGFKGFSFNQDKAGYITDIIPPQQVVEDETNTEKVLYYTLDVQGSIEDDLDYTKLYLGGTNLDNPLSRPAATIGGYRIGAKSGDKLYMKDGGVFEATLEPTGFVKYIANASILNPTVTSDDYFAEGNPDFNLNIDAANLIESNRRMIQEEVFGYILEKYPRLQNISYVNPSLNPAAGRYFDAQNLIQANRQQIVDTAYTEMVNTFGIAAIEGADPIDGGDGKCKRDIGFIVDAVAEDLRDGGNRNIINATRLYFDGNGDAIANGLVGEETPSVFAFNRARDLCKKAVANLLDVKAAIYDPDPNSILAPYGVIAGSTGSAALGLDSEGVTVDESNKQDPAGRYKDARNLIVDNRDFILDAALAEISVYHPDFFIPGDTRTNSQSRYADGFRLIRRNSKEITDRALASIALNHPDFYFPGDPQTDERSRFADAYRLIQLNKDEIQDRALAQIAIDYPDFYFGGSGFTGGGDAQTDAGSRFADGYRLIQQNRTEIVDSAWTNMVAAFPGVAGTETKCKRDIGYFVDAVSLDVFMGGNRYARKFISEYYDSNGNPISNGLVGEEAESVRAFEEARDYMKLAVANQLTVTDLTVTADPDTGSNVDPTSCANVQTAIDNLTDTVNEVLANGIGSLDAEETYIEAFEVGGMELKCRRDLGYFIDAISLDLFINGNEYSHKFIAEYFTNATTPISDGLVGEEAQSITAFEKARDMMKLAVANQLYEKDLTITADPAPGSDYGTAGGNTDNQFNTALCSDVQSSIDTLTGIVTLNLGAGDLSNFPISINKGEGGVGETKCARDIGYFIDAIATDMFVGGNKHTRTFIQQYFVGTGAAATPIADGLVGEEAESVTAFTTASTVMQQAVTNELYYKDLGVTPGQSEYGDGGPVVPNTDPTACADVRSAISELTSYVTTSINEGDLGSLPVESPNNLLAGESKCRRDIGHIVDAVAQDLWFGGNEYTVAATREYFRDGALFDNGIQSNPDESPNGGSEVGPSITAFKRAADLMNRAVNNQYYNRDLTITLDQIGDTTVVADIHADAHDLILKNKEFIAKEAYERMLADFSSYTPAEGNTEQDCLDDVYDVLEVIAHDVKFGGNVKTYDAANIYVTNIYEGDDPSTFTPTFVTYDPASGVAVLTINNHGMEEGQYIKFADESIVFRCATDPSAQTAYPRPGDGNYGQFMEITAVTQSTVTVNAGISTDTSEHTFISAAADSVIYGTTQETFIDSERDEAARVFERAKDIAIQVLKNETVTVSANNNLTQTKDLTIVEDWDIDELLPTCGSAVAAVDTLFGIIIQAIGSDVQFDGNGDPVAGGVGNLSGITRTAPSQPSTYAVGNCSDVLQTIDTLIGIVCDALFAGNLDELPSVSNGNWDCANVRSSIETLFDILTTAVETGSLDDLPVVNSGDFIANAEASKCFRDVAYIVDAIANDLKYGGNVNTIQAGEAYYVGNELEYIDGEKAETIDAWNYVGQLAAAAARNFDFLAFDCSTTAGSAIVNVGTTAGVVIGMSVREYWETDPGNLDTTWVAPYVNGLLQSGAVQRTTTIPEGAYVKRIVDDSNIELGVRGSRLETGNLVLATLSQGSGLNLYFEFTEGAWADTLPATVNVGPEFDGNGNPLYPDVIQDATVGNGPTRECASTVSTINTLAGIITTIIDSGLSYVDSNGNTVPTVDRIEPTFDTANLAKRATLFTIDVTGESSTDPHNFETGTPVRLAPRPRWDVDLKKYVDVDKRLVRLPNGFDTNTTYYVIAPGRFTQPVDYSGTTLFNETATTRLMLATSKENAAAGIYIYASETDVIDPDVEIDIYQFVIDQKYDLHTYTCSQVPVGVQTDIAHIFDKPSFDSESTPQRIFFRGIGEELPPLVSQEWENDPAVALDGRINPAIEFYVRYQTPKTFSVHKTLSDAQQNLDPIKFADGATNFRVFANKKRSPIRFNPAFSDAASSNGKWYLNVKDTVTGELDQNVVDRQIQTLLRSNDYQGKDSTTDTWYERVNDERGADERTYKLRYVIPNYIDNARDPINGFVIKTRTDDTRKLVPQKLLLKPVAGNVYGARFEIPGKGELIGDTLTQVESKNIDVLEPGDAYDPYLNPIYARFTSGVQATIQSGRYITDPLNENIQYLEITVFDHSIDTVNFGGLRNEILTTVKITAPQGGSFTTNKTQKIVDNSITFTGNSSGTAYVHGYFNVGGDHYLIIKGISGARGVASLEYNEFQSTRFQQGSVFADMLEDQDMGKSLPLKTHIRKNYPEYFYKQNGANVYTITPGDRLSDSAGIEYYVESVEDVGVIEDTFYIFNAEELQRRIPGQQDGIYYLTALRGNVSPLPLGAGISTNFQKFKFSQPVGKLYPLNYRNDPLWFKNSGTTSTEKSYYSELIDPPQSYSAADNYIHGKVTVNDVKNSVTRELVIDLLKQPSFVENEYTTVSDEFTSVIQAQLGNASAGSEDRLIPIAGDNRVWTDQRYYVELRRPSIARAGNHTFEYLGFGPGNYSTGLPARQEIVLLPEEDFYAQSKKQDAGIVFYTGINSQGDLYIGNRRINAITGEETFIDRALLADDGDEDDVIGQLVTSFETPVTFNQNITIVGGDDGTLVSNFNAPITITVSDGPIPPSQLQQQGVPLVIKSFVAATDYYNNPQDDFGLDRDNFPLNSVGDNTGDIRIGKNRIDSAIFAFNPRGGFGQGYKFQTHAPGGVSSNVTPNNDSQYQLGAGNVNSGGTAINAAAQNVTYSSVLPETGDVLLKGVSINGTGSLGWVFANSFITIEGQDPSTRKIDEFEVVVEQNVNIVRITFQDTNGQNLSLTSLGITSTSEVRLDNININTALNGTWKIVNTEDYPFVGSSNTVYFEIVTRSGQPIGAFGGGNPAYTWLDLVNDASNPSPNAKLEFSDANWKETMVIGAEAIRTETRNIGQYKLGINTLARATRDIAYEDAFVEPLNTDPRANLDVVGNAYITGYSLFNWYEGNDYLTRQKLQLSTAFVVGFVDEAGSNSNDIDDVTAVFRVSTVTEAVTESGRGNNFGQVGINIDNNDLDRALVVKGDSRFTEDAKFERDIEVEGDGNVAEIRTVANNTFNLVNETAFTGTLNVANSATTANITNAANTVNFANGAETLRIADVTTNSQTIDIGNNASTNTIKLGDNVTGDQFIHIGSASTHSNIFIGDTPDLEANISKISLGGAYLNNSSNSFVTVGTRRLNAAGDLFIGANKTLGGDRLNPDNIVTLSTEAGIVRLFSGSTQTMDFALNASEVNIAGQGGTTTIRNNLVVDSTARFNSNIILCGGFSSYSFNGDRSQLGSTAFSHDSGVITETEFNQNVDIINVLVVPTVNKFIPTPAELTAGYNRVDTGGQGSWGGNSGSSNFQAVVPGGGPEGADLPALTGDEYYLPLKYKPTPYFEAGDFIIVDTAVNSVTGQHPEIVRITEDGLAGASSAPYYIKVKRQPLGTFTAIRSDHTDESDVWKLNVAFDATWTTAFVDGSGVQDPVYLSEFGGSLEAGVDYVIIDREDPNEDGIYEQGEVIKVASLLDLVPKKFSVKNGCDTAAETTVFEVDSTDGSVLLGDAGNLNTTTYVYGNLNVNGYCADSANPDNNTKLKFFNELYQTAEIDVCTGDSFFGSNFATVFAIGAFYGSTPAAHTTDDVVHVYRRDPFAQQALGPSTTIVANADTGSMTSSTVNIAVNDASAFAKGDLVIILDGTNQKAEIVLVTDDPYTIVGENASYDYLPTGANSTYPPAQYPNGGRGQEGTVALDWNPNDTVIKILKDERTTTLAEAIPETGRVSVESPNTDPNKIRMRLVNGDLVAEKLDREYFIRIGTEFFWPDSIDGSNDPVYGVRLPKSVRNDDNTVTKFFGGGNLTTHGNLEITSGNIRMYGTDGTTLVFNVTNDDGHPGDGAIVDPVTGRNGMYLKGFANIFGNLQVYNDQCQEYGSCDNELVFKVERDNGSVEMGESLYIKGLVQATESGTVPLLHIDNIGSAGNALVGPKDFIMYQDGSIDAFGISQYFNSNGGRRWTYITQAADGNGQTVGNPLQANNNYLLNLTAGGNMVVYLPTNVQTGDMIRFIELTGNLSYNTNLVIRALPIDGNAVAIQGDTIGTRLSAGSGSSLLATPYAGGELVVQTRNASFGLVYVGVSDAINDPVNSSTIPANLRGWWLVEL